MADEEDDDIDAEDDEIDSDELQLTNTGLWVVRTDHVVLTTVVDEFAEEKRRHGFIFHWLGEDWPKQLVAEFLCGVCALSGPPVQAISVGVTRNGSGTARPGGKTMKKVDSPERRGTDLGLL